MTRCIHPRACRTPIGSFGGALKDRRRADLGAVVISEAIARAGVAPADIDDVVLGCVLQAGAGHERRPAGGDEGRAAGEVPAETVNRVCGSGLQAVMHAAKAIASARRRVVAGGTESMSQRAVSAEGRALGLPHGQRRSLRHDGRRRADLRHRALPHGHYGRGDCGRYGISRSRSGRVRGREPAARRSRRFDAGRFDAEIVPVAIPQKKGDPIRVRARRISARRHDRREAGRAQAGVPEGRHRHRRQRIGHQRRRRGARGHQRESARSRGVAATRAMFSHATAGVDPMFMGWARFPRSGRRSIAPDSRRGRRSLRAQRSLRRAGHRRRTAIWSSIPRA